MMRELGVIARYPRLVVAQAENANPLYRAWSAGKREVEPIQAKPTLASAIQIGNPVSAPRAIRALEAMNGIVEQASEEELADAAARADRTGMYTCPHTAVALAVLEKLVARGVIEQNRPRRLRLDRERPQVHRVQGALPRAHDRRRREPEGESAGDAAPRPRPRRRRDTPALRVSGSEREARPRAAALGRDVGGDPELCLLRQRLAGFFGWLVGAGQKHDAGHSQRDCYAEGHVRNQRVALDVVGKVGGGSRVVVALGTERLDAENVPTTAPAPAMPSVT